MGAWKAGLRWGIGHASGVLLVGIGAILFREWLPMEAISTWSERLVGVLLVAIGCWGLRKAFHVHSHHHSHGGESHAHLHIHAPGKAHSQEQHHHQHAALGIGTLHGLAGSSHFFGVLAALAFASKWESLSYLLSYGVGSVLAMVLFSSGVAYLSKKVVLTSVVAYRRMLGGISLTALCMGAYWIAQN
jgi:sulfite exporter TauE/SafE